MRTSQLLESIEQGRLEESYNNQSDLRHFMLDIARDFKGRRTGSGRVVLGGELRMYNPVNADVNGPVRGGHGVITLLPNDEAGVEFKREPEDSPKIQMTVYGVDSMKPVAKVTAPVKRSLDGPFKRLIEKALKKL